MSHKKGGNSFFGFHVTAATSTAAPTPTWEEAWKAKAPMKEAKAPMKEAKAPMEVTANVLWASSDSRCIFAL
jgi:hypothetical protein